MATKLPIAVAMQFTTSLFIHWIPRKNCVRVPQWWICCSVSVLQVGQKYIAWEVAPRKLSKQLPAMPLINARNGAIERDLHRPLTSQKKYPREHAPRAEAVIPNGVIPPEVPGAIDLPFVIKRGGVLLSVPSSVAQVSAVAVASAPMKPDWASRRMLGDREKP